MAAANHHWHLFLGVETRKLAVSTVIDKDMHTAQQLVVVPLRSDHLTHVVNDAVVPKHRWTGTEIPGPKAYRLEIPGALK